MLGKFMTSYFSLIFRSLFVGVMVCVMFAIFSTSAEAVDKYWVGGTGSWSDTSHWSLSSGGASGASVPSNSDDVFFDGNSGTGTATVDTSASTRSLNFTGYGGTFAGSSALNIAGSLTMGAGMSRTYTGAITFSSTTTGNTLTFNGKTMASATTFNGSGGAWTLQDAWNNGSSNITLTAGSLDTNGQSVTTTGVFNGSGSTARALTFGASQITVGDWTFTTTTNLTFDSGTSIISVTDSGTFAGGTLTYNEVRITDNGNVTMRGQNIFSVLQRSSTSSFASLTIQDSQTVNDELSLIGNNSGGNRLSVTSLSIANPRSLIVGDATVTLENVDFRDITLSGNNAPYSGTSIGNAYGNSGITFTSPTTRYWVGNGGNWTDTTHWSISSGGAGGATMPLPQDDVYFDANSFNVAGQEVSLSAATVVGKNIIWSGVTNNPSFRAFQPFDIGGSFILDPNMTFSAVNGVSLVGRDDSFTLNPAGKQFITLSINAPGGIYTLLGDLISGSITSGSFGLGFGTFDANDFNVTINNFSSSSFNVRALNMGSGTWEIIGDNSTALWNINSSFNMTLNAETSTIRLTGALAADRVFAGGGLTYYNFENDTTGNFAVRIAGSNNFNNFKLNPGTGILFTAGTTTTVASFDATGTSGNEITITSATAANHTLTKTGGGVVSADYLILSLSTATPADTWYAGNNSTNGGNNSGWLFESPNDPPEAPASLGPSSMTDGSFTTDSTPNVTFTLSDPNGSDTVKYRIQIDNTSDFSSPVVDYTSALAAQGNFNFNVGQAEGSGTYSVGSSGQSLSDDNYYWRVLATDNSDDSSSYSTANGGSIAFKVDATAPSEPGTPSTSSPTDGASQTWVWSAAIDAFSGVSTYAWRVINAITLLPVTSGTTSLVSVVTDLAAGTYQLFVKAIDTVGNEGSESQGQVIVITPSPAPQTTSNSNPCPGFTICPNVNSGENAMTNEVVMGGSGSTSIGELIIPPDASPIDLALTIDELKPNDLLVLSDPVPFPWQQGYNTASEIFNFSAVSAFNGYPVTGLAEPAIILMSYNPAKLYGKSPDSLRIAFFNATTGRWQIIPANTVIDEETNTIANTTTVFSYYTVVYPRNGLGSVGTQTSKKVPAAIVLQDQSKPALSPVQEEKKISQPVQEKEKTCFLFICW